MRPPGRNIVEYGFARAAQNPPTSFELESLSRQLPYKNKTVSLLPVYRVVDRPGKVVELWATSFRLPMTQPQVSARTERGPTGPKESSTSAQASIRQCR